MLEGRYTVTCIGVSPPLLSAENNTLKTSRRQRASIARGNSPRETFLKKGKKIFDTH
jgi:hypothetical protein